MLRIGEFGSLLLMRSVAVLMPAAVVLGGLNTMEMLIDLPGESVSGSTGLLTISNCAASVPVICNPSDGIASAEVPILVIFTSLEGEAAPPRTSLKNRLVVLSLILAPLTDSGRSSVMRLAPYSTT